MSFPTKQKHSSEHKRAGSFVHLETRVFIVGVEYLVKNKKCVFIQISETAFNFLDMSSYKCMLMKNIYKNKKSTDDKLQFYLQVDISSIISYPKNNDK